ncbi:PAS domain S-box protein [bacterium]|nr:PAS domain S-box protein [bacterium]
MTDLITKQLEKVSFETGNEQLLSIFDSIDEVIYISDPETWEVIYLNQAAKNLFGDHTGEKCYEAFHDLKQPCPFCTNDKIFGSNTGKTYIWEFHNKKSNRWFRCIDKAIKLTDGRDVRYEMALDITESKRIEEELRRSETRYREMFERISNGVTVYRAVNNGRDFVIVDFNHGAENIEKVDRKDVIGKKITEAFPGVKDFGLLEVIQRVWKTGNPEQLPLSLYKDERIIGWRENYIYRLPSGEIVTVYSDATKRKQSEDALRIRDLAMNQSLNAIAIADINGIITYVNPAFLKMWKCELKDVKWKQIDSLIRNGGYNIRIKDMLEKEGKWVGELRGRRIDDSLFDVELAASIVKNPNGEPTNILLTFNDISERKAALIALRESEERLRSFHENTSLGIYRTTPAGRVIMANPAFLSMLGFTSLAEINRDLEDRSVESGYSRQRFRIAIERNDELRNYESEWRRKNGTTLYLRENARVFRDENDEVVYYEGTVEDITELKKVEAEKLELKKHIMQAQKMESLGILAGGIAHDFNNLLQGIIGNADFAMMDIAATSPIKDCIDQIQKSGQRAAELSRQMLAYSGKGKFLITPIDLSEQVKDMTELLQTSISKKANIRLELDSNLPLIEADVTQVRQVIMNFITNASESLADESGIITISTGTLECDDKFLKTTYIYEDISEGTYAYIKVSDSGCGMDEQTLNKIFDPFFTTKFTGRGLGLSAVLGIIRGHKGAIKVTSRPGEGASFLALFPIASKKIKISAKDEEATSDKKGSGTILVVDDEEIIRSLADRVLTRAGFKVLLASDGLNGVNTFRKHADEIRLVLLDLTMPRMNGEEVFEEIKKINNEVQIILSSGYDEVEASKRFAGKGLSGFIQKPYRPSSLSNKILELLN